MSSTRLKMLLGSVAVALAACGGQRTPAAGQVVPPDASTPPPTQTTTSSSGQAAIQFGTPGPWSTSPVTVYSGAQGLDSDVVDASTDEAQNIWVVTHQALYLLEPGQTQFRKYTGADGLHLDNAEPPGITAVTGGAPGEVWVGYKGADIVDVQHDPLRFKGKLDRVLLQQDRTLQVTHYDVHNNDAVGLDASGNPIRLPSGAIDPQFTDWSFNEDRSVERFLYDHVYHRGTMYVGYNHGVARFNPGQIDPVTGFDYADHVHPVVTNSSGTQRMGDWRALALDASVRKDKNGNDSTGVLWMGGRWTGGAITWTHSLFDWARNERNPFLVAYQSLPIFPVNQGDDVYVFGIAALSDGRVYFASGPGNFGFSPLGIALVQSGHNFTYLSPGSIGLPSSNIVDMQRLPDDTILVALPDSLWHWDPSPAPQGATATRVSGLPGSQVRRVYVDQMVSPPAAYVSTDAGVAALRF